MFDDICGGACNSCKKTGINLLFYCESCHFGWTNCAEQMPEKDGRYLIYTPSYNWIGVSSLRNGKWDDELASHWMPLPNPPEINLTKKEK